MHIGGGLLRQRAGVTTVHLAEILANRPVSMKLSDRTDRPTRKARPRDGIQISAHVSQVRQNGACQQPVAPQPRQSDHHDSRQTRRCRAHDPVRSGLVCLLDDSSTRPLLPERSRVVYYLAALEEQLLE